MTGVRGVGTMLDPSLRRQGNEQWHRLSPGDLVEEFGAEKFGKLYHGVYVGVYRASLWTMYHDVLLANNTHRFLTHDQLIVYWRLLRTMDDSEG